MHDEWSDNIFLHTHVQADLAAIKARAPVVVRRYIRTARQSMAPMEGRGVVCQWDSRLEQLVMHSSAQMPHINRAGLSECLGLDQGRIRVISPDVGGGFGYKGILLPEEICLAWLAIKLRRPVRWIEDRREQLTASTNCREHDYDITLYAEKNGRLLAIDCDATVDSGAYSSYPFSACLEAAQIGSILPGRCAVMSGGAVATACKALVARVLPIAAVLLEAPVESLSVADGGVLEPTTGRRVSLAEVAHAWYRQPQRMPKGIDAAGLEVTVGYKAMRDSGTFSYAAHACAVAVDTELGTVEILDYVISEDGGVLLNPMVADGQVLGGLAQGIGTALYEEMVYDAAGQPQASTLADYMLPGATEVPGARIDHLETPSPYTEFGQKGIGEGGAIAPPAAIVNAINDALAALGAEITECPASPRRILDALRRAGART